MTSLEYLKINPYCYICNQPGEVHHIVSKGASGPNEPWNFMTLCHNHHNIYHSQGWQTFIDLFPWAETRIIIAREIGHKKTDLPEKHQNNLFEDK